MEPAVRKLKNQGRTLRGPERARGVLPELLGMALVGVFLFGTPWPRLR